MRLNLPRYNCVHFSLSSEFTVSPDRDADIQTLMNQTHTHGPVGNGERTQVAFFGSRSKVSGVTHMVVARLAKMPQDNALNYSLTITSDRASDTLSSPPKEIRPVSRLIQSASRLLGTINVSFDTTFEYDHAKGFRSKISFPIPLMVQEEAAGITHIESAEFSRRDNDDIEYKVLVSTPEGSDSFLHFVDFRSAIELNPNSIRGLLDRARAVSTRLVVQEGVDLNSGPIED